MAEEGTGAQVEELEVDEFLGPDGEPVSLSKPAEAAAKPATAPATTPPQEQQQVSAVDRAFIESKRQPGESWEDAAVRLYSNSINARRRIENEKKENARALRELAEQQARQRQELEPFLREYYRSRQIEAQREQMAAIPDKETDPQGYAIWLAEETLRRQTQQERETAAALAEEQRLAAVADADETWATELQEALQVPEFDADFRLVAEFGRQSLRHEFPDAREEQIEELLLGANTLAMRNALTSGRTVQQYIWERAQLLRSFAGKAAAQTALQPKAPTPAQLTSPTAKRLASAAARAQKAGAMAGPAGPGGAGGLPGQGDSILDLPEDEFIQAALGQKIDVNTLSKRRFGVQD